MPAVSVLMPCYNAEGTLEEALGSLAAQTSGDYEIVAVDDGSTDGSVEMLRAWAVRDGRPRVPVPFAGGVGFRVAWWIRCSPRRPGEETA